MTDLSQPITFTATTLAPGPPAFVYDDIGFGPISGSIEVTEDTLGIALPLLDIGFNLDYVFGARLVLDVGFGTPTVNVNYQISDGTFENQTSLDFFLQNKPFRDQIELLPHYRNAAISFNAGTIDFLKNSGALTVTAPKDPAHIHLYFDYIYKITARDPFIKLGWPIDEGLSANLNLVILDSEQDPTKPSTIDIIPL